MGSVQRDLQISRNALPVGRVSGHHLRELLRCTTGRVNAKPSELRLHFWIIKRLVGRRVKALGNRVWQAFGPIQSKPDH